MRTATQKPSRSGLHGLMAKISSRGLRALDRRSAGYRALLEWRRELEQDLGGVETLSAQQRTLVELACRIRLYLDHVDSWLMLQPSLINRRRRAVLPIVAQRMQLSDSLARLLAQLGLQRHAKPVPSLKEYVAQKESAS